MKKRIILKRGIAYLLAAAMVVGLMVCTPSDMMNVQAADDTSTTTGKTITGLGTSGIADPIAPASTSDAWTGSYVYFGTYNGSPVKYRVLDSNTTVFGGTTMLLDCDSVLWAGSDPSSAFDADSNVWADSDIRTYLNGTFLTGNFSATEQSAIAPSTKSAADSTDGNGSTYLSYTSLSGDKIFFLDAKEATNTSYGYSDTNSDATNRKKTSGNAYWWLRSANTSGNGYAGYVDSDGYIYRYSANVSNNNVGVSSALNVNLSSVLFSSVISGTAGETGAEYKLTLFDSNMTIVGNQAITRSGDVVTIPYTISGTNATNATQVSILILDREYSEATKNEAVVKYYSALDTSAGNGIGTFTLPAELSDKVCCKDYYAYIIAEDVNGAKETDYASSPVEIQVPYKTPTVNPINIGTTALYSIPGGWNNTYGVKVWFGQYNGSLTTFRVLGPSEDTMSTSNAALLLDCDVALDNSHMSFNQSNVNKWEESKVRTFLSGVNYYSNENVFTSLEKSAILETTLKNINDYTVNADYFIDYESADNVFLLSAKEMNELYWDDASRIKLDRDGNGAHCWLRSTNVDSSGDVASFYSGGVIVAYDYNNLYIRVSPALNLNISSVLLTSMNGQVKTDAITRESDIFTSVNNRQWKLTLLDAGKTVEITDNDKAIKAANGTITVPYTYTDTATTAGEKVNQISVMITDKVYTEADAQILYYGALQGTDFSATSGTGTFALPSALDDKVIGTDYHVYILAEHTTNTNSTDYASAPVEITDVYDEISSISVGVDAPVAGTAFDTTATTSDTEYSVTTVTWQTGSNTATGNADYDTAYTVKITLTADSEYVFADNVTATVNNHTATVTGNDDGTITVSYTFEKTQMGTITHTATGYEGTYDGQSHGITVAVTVPSDTTVTYSTDGSAYSETNPTFTDAGVYTVYYKVTKDKYEAATGEVVVTITKKALSVTADNQTITEGDSVDNSKYSVSGLVSGDTLSSVTLTQSTTEVTDNGTIEASGAKIVNADGKDVTANYDITYTAGKLVVNEVEGELQPDEYEITDGADSEWTVDSDVSITITGNGDFAKFVGVKVDGKLIDEANYTAKSGSTIVTLKSSYLNTLSAGEHTFEIVWSDGLASTTFTVKPTEDDKVSVDPNTGDNSSLGLWLVLLIGSGLTAVGFWKKKKYIIEE